MRATCGISIFDTAKQCLPLPVLAVTAKLLIRRRWEARLTQDLNTLMQHAVAGHGRMPPKGGFSELTDAEVAAAVAYAVNESRRVIASLKKTQNSDECHPFKSPEKCSKSELREVLTLHMLWLLGATKGEQ
jgi:hypothetical protein